ncbi:hypothetical protein D3C76_1069680 [compost metagenome]
MYRAAHSDITIDSQKIDDDYLRLKQMESDFAEAELEREIGSNANQDIIDITPPGGPEVESEPKPEASAQKIASSKPSKKTQSKEPDLMEMDFEINPDDIPQMDGPDF